MGILKKAAAPAAAPSPSKKATGSGKEAAYARYEAKEKISRFVSKKKAATAASSTNSGPLLDLHGSFSRAALLTPLRLAFTSDTLTLTDLNRLLCASSLGLSDTAASAISEQVFAAYGDSFTIEQLVCLLVPVRRVPSFEELTESEVALLRAKFFDLGDGTIGPSQLAKAALELPGLHDGPLSAADSAAIKARMEAECDGQADLETLFNLFREQQSASRPPPTALQLTKAFGAFDRTPSAAQSARQPTTVLPVDRVRGVVKLFDGPDLKPDVLKASKAAVHGGAGDVSAKELAKASKLSQNIDVPSLIEAHDDAVQKQREVEDKAASKAAEKAAKAAEKDADKGGGGFGGLLGGLFHKRAEKAAAPAAEASPAEAAEAAEADKLVAEIQAAVDAEKAKAHGGEEDEGKGGWFGGWFGGKKAPEAASEEPTGGAELKPQSMQLL